MRGVMTTDGDVITDQTEDGVKWAFDSECGEGSRVKADGGLGWGEVGWVGWAGVG